MQLTNKYNYDDAIKFITWCIERLHCYEFVTDIEINVGVNEYAIHFYSKELNARLCLDVYKTTDGNKFAFGSENYMCKNYISDSAFSQIGNLIKEANEIKSDAMYEGFNNIYNIFD